jgi:FAD/FMN-containing dehydrogenase
MARLMVGSEGTLGVVVEATIALVPLPRAKAVLAIQFAELLDALEATPAILAHRPSAIEVMDGFILGHTKQSAALDRLRRTFIDGDPGALLCVELYGETRDELLPRLDALERDLAARRVGDRYHRALDPESQAAIWSLREAALGLSMAMKGDAKSLSFVEDTAVRPEVLRRYIERFLEMVRRHGTDAGVYAHASVGCLHVRPVVNLKTEAGVRQFEAIASASADLVLEFGGALSGEHGDGLVRSPFMEKMFGPVLYDAFRRIKQTFDPDGLFNPGKIVDAPPLSSNLRYGPAYRAAQPATFFDYAEHGGLAGAVEMCSGLGACR